MVIKTVELVGKLGLVRVNESDVEAWLKMGYRLAAELVHAPPTFSAAEPETSGSPFPKKPLVPKVSKK